MPKHNKHLHLHIILRRTAESQMLFSFVVGVMEADSTISVRRAITMFKNTFCLPELDVNSSIGKFHRMRGEMLRNQNIFQDDTCKTPGPGRRQV